VRLPGAPGQGPTSTDVAGLVREAARTLGHRPAVTVVARSSRTEQGVASLAGWCAKGAHLIGDELGLAPGDVLGLDAPPSWTTATVCLAAWWAGVTIVPADRADTVVVHARRRRPDATRVLVVGDDIDGGDADVDPDDTWTLLAQPMPDRAPTPGGDADALALRLPTVALTQAALIARAGVGPAGTLGLVAHTASGPFGGGRDERGVEVLVAVALRPLVRAAATVIALDVAPEAAAREGVVHWIDLGDAGDAPDA